MEALLSPCSSASFNRSILPTKHSSFPVQKPFLRLPSKHPKSSSSTICRSRNKNHFKIFSTESSSSSPDISTAPAAADPTVPDIALHEESEKFDWFSNWYPLAPVCDLDKRVPHAKTVMGLDVVVWWDRAEEKWQVFDDRCPHRLAPLSEGRIDQWGRLQCIYHGWCFNGAGDCKFIPQAPPEGPPIHTFKKACVAVYPSCEQNKIVWFWPSTDPQYNDILMKKKPPYIAELDDPSFSNSFAIRDIPYGYEVLIENLMDPAHVPYAHYGIMQLPTDKTRPKRDQEGGGPLQCAVETLDATGFFADQDYAYSKFIAPCIFYVFPKSEKVNELTSSQESSAAGSSSKKRRISLLIFFCIPVGPGQSRLIGSHSRNFSLWVDRIVPRWVFHIGLNLVIDSDLYLLHLEEKKIAEVGGSNWQKACFVPTKSDALVVAFRKWLKKYAGSQIAWSNKFSELPPTPSREQLFDRYRSHVVHCSSCRVAVKGLKALEVSLQIISLASIGLVATLKQNVMSMVAWSALVLFALVSFLTSKWLSHFIYKNFYCHDYNHAFVGVFNSLPIFCRPPDAIMK